MTKEEQTLLKYVHCLFPRPNNPNRTTTHLSRSPADQSEQDAINKREKNDTCTGASKKSKLAFQPIRTIYKTLSYCHWLTVIVAAKIGRRQVNN
jgi:hypothetical protein